MLLEREQELLQKTHDIIEAYQTEKINQMQCGKNTGNQFNIFEIIGISTREVYMCKVLAELLSPKGCHHQGTKYLGLFCERFLPENIKREINLDKVSIITEDLTKNLDEIGKEFRRIDIVIDEENGHYIPIEVKINAFEQKEQCSDYLQSARKIYEARHKNKNDAIIFYLTKTGEMPISISSCDKENVKCISWAQIVDWLNECICQIDTIRKIPITEIIMQYKTTIENFLKGGNNTMDNENIINMITDNKKNFESAEKIAENITAAKQRLWNTFAQEIYNRLNESGYDNDKLYRDSDKVAYVKSEFDDNNIAKYNVIVYESGKIQMAGIWYKKNNNEIRYNKELKNTRKIIEFASIIDDDKLKLKLKEKAKECVSFLLD